MKLILIAAIVFLPLTKTAFIKVDDSATPIFTIKPSKVYNNVSLTKTTYHNFSSKIKPDKFEITLKGKTILSGKVVFTIHNALGKLIYKDSFDASLLIDYGLYEENPSVKKQEMYIKKRFSAYFDEDKFDLPAIKNDNFDSDYSEDKNVWEELKANPASIGFTYLTGEENSRSISWSP